MNDTTMTQAPLISDAQLADLLAGYDHVPGREPACGRVFARRVLPRLQDVRDAYELRLTELRETIALLQQETPDHDRHA